MNILYISLDRRENRLGWLLALFYIPAAMFFTWAGWDCFLLALAFCAVILPVFRRFWKETAFVLATSWKSLLWKPLAVCLLAKLCCTVINDIAFFYGLTFTVETGWGPFLWDIRADLLSRNLSPVSALTMVFLLPIVEEFLFRGVIFGTLYSKSSLTAFLAATVLFALFHSLPYLSCFQPGSPYATLYLPLYFIQYIPFGLLLAGLYTHMDTLAAPIVMHMIYNAYLLKAALNY